MLDTLIVLTFCLRGPAAGYPPGAAMLCLPVDYTHDGRVDLRDVAAYQRRPQAINPAAPEATLRIKTWDDLFELSGGLSEMSRQRDAWEAVEWGDPEYSRPVRFEGSVREGGTGVRRHQSVSVKPASVCSVTLTVEK